MKIRKTRIALVAMLLGACANYGGFSPPEGRPPASPSRPVGAALAPLPPRGVAPPPPKIDDGLQTRAKLAQLEEQVKQARTEVAAAKAAAQAAQASASQAAAQKPQASVPVRAPGYDPRNSARENYSYVQYNIRRNQAIDARLQDERRATLMQMFRNAGMQQAQATKTRIEDQKNVWEDWTFCYAEWTLKLSVREDGSAVYYSRFRTPDAGTDDDAIIAALQADKPTSSVDEIAFGFKQCKLWTAPADPVKKTDEVTCECLFRIIIADLKAAANCKK